MSDVAKKFLAAVKAVVRDIGNLSDQDLERVEEAAVRLLDHVDEATGPILHE